VLLAAPSADVHWEHHPSHFWLVLITAAVSTTLAFATSGIALKRADARLLGVAIPPIVQEHGGEIDSLIGARLESQAPPGRVVIGASTLRAIPGTHVEALAPLRVKGRSEEVDAYLVEDALQRGQA
jgi:hypothetical protein